MGWTAGFIVFRNDRARKRRHQRRLEETAKKIHAEDPFVNAEEAEQLATERVREGPRLIEWFGMIFGGVIIFFLFLSWIKKAIDWISE